MDIHYIIGNALDPIITPALICHVCNDVGKMGSGFVVPLCKINPNIRVAYERWYKEGSNSTTPFELGAIQILNLKDDIWIANMIAQHDIRSINGVPPIRYDALSSCLYNCYTYAFSNKLTVHMPRIGAVRSGGDWNKISEIIQFNMNFHYIETYVYTLPDEVNQWPDTPYENKETTDSTQDIDALNKMFK